MKKLLLFFLLLTNISTNGQVYHPLLNNTKWSVKTTGFGFSGNAWVLPLKDTVVFAKTFTMYIDSSWNTGPYFVREDTVAKKVYRVKNNAEEILFDFSLQLGDSIKLGDNRFYKLISITQFNVNGGTRRAFKLCTYNSSGFPLSYEDWLESVGNQNSPLRPFYELFSDPAFSINCNYQQDVQLFINGNANCPALPLSVGIINSAYDQVTFYPNPFSNQLTFSLADNKERTVSIYNFLGQQILKQQFTNSITLGTAQLANGIYFYELRNGNEIIKTGKIIKR